MKELIEGKQLIQETISILIRIDDITELLDVPPIEHSIGEAQRMQYWKVR